MADDKEIKQEYEDIYHPNVFGGKKALQFPKGMSDDEITEAIKAHPAYEAPSDPNKSWYEQMGEQLNKSSKAQYESEKERIPQNSQMLRKVPVLGALYDKAVAETPEETKLKQEAPDTVRGLHFGGAALGIPAIAATGALSLPAQFSALAGANLADTAIRKGSDITGRDVAVDVGTAGAGPAVGGIFKGGSAVLRALLNKLSPKEVGGLGSKTLTTPTSRNIAEAVSPEEKAAPKTVEQWAEDIENKARQTRIAQAQAKRSNLSGTVAQDMAEGKPVGTTYADAKDVLKEIRSLEPSVKMRGGVGMGGVGLGMLADLYMGFGNTHGAGTAAGYFIGDKLPYLLKTIQNTHPESIARLDALLKSAGSHTKQVSGYSNVPGTLINPALKED